jgi:uncharacterized protein
MHPDLEHFLQLDKIDREIKRLRAEVAALPQRVAEIETHLSGINAEIEQSRKTLKDIEPARRKQESDIAALRQKISKYRDQMLSVKTNQEYKALGSEIQFAEQEIGQIEDKILEGMLAVEACERQLKASEADQKKQQAEVDKEKTAARNQTQQNEKELAELTATRATVREAITPEILRHYDRVLRLRGSAVAEARDQYCMACHVMLRPQVFNDVMSDQQVITCDSCCRILYFNPDNAAQPEGSSETKEISEPAAELSDPS